MKRRPLPGQLAFPGVASAPARRTQPGTSRPRWIRTSLGLTLRPPIDRKGRLLEMGPLRVLQRVTGEYIVFDERGPLGRSTRYVARQGGPQGLREAVVEMVRLAKIELAKMS